MDDREQKRGGGGCVTVGCLGICLLPVLYVLGIGPAAWLATNVQVTEPFLEVLYHPLLFLHDYSESVGFVLEWYMHLWVE